MNFLSINNAQKHTAIAAFAPGFAFGRTEPFFSPPIVSDRAAFSSEATAAMPEPAVLVEREDELVFIFLHCTGGGLEVSPTSDSFPEPRSSGVGVRARRFPRETDMSDSDE